MDNSPFNFQAQSPAYAIKNHENYEDENFLMTQNFLLFKDPVLKQEKFEALYKSKLDASPSKEFVCQLASYAGVLWLSILMHLIGRLVIFSETNHSKGKIAMHIACVFSCLLYTSPSPRDS